MTNSVVTAVIMTFMLICAILAWLATKPEDDDE